MDSFLITEKPEIESAKEPIPKTALKRNKPGLSESEKGKSKDNHSQPRIKIMNL